MLFVINRLKLQRAIAIVREDRSKRSQGLAGPWMRLEARDDYVKLDGHGMSAKIPATVYEPGVLFLKVTLFRRLLQTFKGDRFLTIQVVDEGLLVDHVRMPLESNDMLLYANPDQAPKEHPALRLSSAGPDGKSGPKYRQPSLWNEIPTEIDPGIRDTVVLLWGAGFKTFTPCKGERRDRLRQATIGLKLVGPYSLFRKKLAKLLQSHGMRDFTVSCVTEYDADNPEGKTCVYLQGLDLLSEAQKRLLTKKLERKRRRKGR